jgi:hypothetical protein
MDEGELVRIGSVAADGRFTINMERPTEEELYPITESDRVGEDCSTLEVTPQELRVHIWEPLFESFIRVGSGDAATSTYSLSFDNAPLDDLGEFPDPYRYVLYGYADRDAEISVNCTKRYIDPDGNEHFSVTTVVDATVQLGWQALLLEETEETGSETDPRTITVLTDPPPTDVRWQAYENFALRFSLTADPWEGAAPLEVTFTITLFNEDAMVENIIWNFNAEADDGPRLEGTDLTVSHVYTEPGEYLACANVAFQSGNIDFSCVPISVTAD